MKKIEPGCLAVILSPRFAGRVVEIIKLLRKESDPRNNYWAVDLDVPCRKGSKGWKSKERYLMRIDGFKSKKTSHKATEAIYNHE